MKKSLYKLIILLAVCLLLKECFLHISLSNKNSKKVESYFNNESSARYENDMVIEIPKVNLKNIVIRSSSDFKELNESLVYYENNDYNKKIVIFGHSGMGYGTYFNRLDELKRNDFIYLYSRGNKITYEVEEIYTIKEDDLRVLEEEKNRVLYLVTCLKSDKKMRLVVKLLYKSAKTLKK